MNVSELRTLIGTELADVHTCLPGQIVDYDGEYATVRPTIDKQLANGETLAAPIIARVPVCWPIGDVNGAQALFTVPLKAGDPVLLHFSERALEDWLGGTDGPPGDPRQFDLSDAFATPMARPGTIKADIERVSLQYGPMTLKITPEGEVTLDTTANVTVQTTTEAIVRAPLVTVDALETVMTGNLQLAGFLTMGTGGSGTGARAKIRGPVEVIDGDLLVPGHDVIAGTISLRNHVHPENDGGGPTDPPTP